MAASTLIVLLALAPSVFGQVVCDKFSNSIETQADIDEISQCSVVDGLGIDRDFRGAAYIPGITKARYFGAGNPGASHSTPTLGPTYVESISLPDLVSVESLRISGADYLTEFIVPKLKTVDGILQVTDTKIKSHSFPSLETISSVSYISGVLDELSLPKLTKARSMNIQTTGNLDCVALWAQLKSITWTDPDTWVVPAFSCKSALNEATSGLTARPSTTTSPSSTTESFSISSSTLPSTTPSAPGVETHTSTAAAASVTIPPVHGNGTVTLRTSSTRGPAPTAAPTPLGTNAGNVLAVGLWSTIGSIAAVAAGALFL